MDSRISEKELQASVVELAEMTGWMYYHTYDSRRSPAGFPDLVLVRRGRLIFAELKSGNGRLTVNQKLWLDELRGVEKRSCGNVRVFLWRPEDWASGAVEEVLT